MANERGPRRVTEQPNLNLGSLWKKLGVIGPDGAAVSTLAHLQWSLGNLSEFIAPLSIGVRGYASANSTNPPGLGNHATAYFESAAPGGALVLNVEGSSGTSLYAFGIESAIPGTFNQVTATDSQPRGIGDPLCTLQGGEDTATIPTFGALTNTDWVNKSGGIFVPPGSILGCQKATSNSFAFFHFSWIEFAEALQ